MFDKPTPMPNELKLNKLLRIDFITGRSLNLALPATIINSTNELEDAPIKAVNSGDEFITKTFAKLAPTLQISATPNIAMAFGSCLICSNGPKTPLLKAFSPNLKEYSPIPTTIIPTQPSIEGKVFSKRMVIKAVKKGLKASIGTTIDKSADLTALIYKIFPSGTVINPAAAAHQKIGFTSGMPTTISMGTITNKPKN